MSTAAVQVEDKLVSFFSSFPENMTAFEFDEATHVYRREGRPIPSCTQMLKAAGLINFDKADPEDVKRKQLLGKLVHQAVHFYDENDLPEQLPEEVAMRLDGYKLFRRESGYVPYRNEGRQVSSVHGMWFGMQFDSVGIFKGRPSILDVKTGAKAEPAWGVQTAGYELGLPKLPLPHRNYQRIVVQLFEDGRYKCHEYKEPADAQIFVACLALATWKSNKRIQ